MYTYQFNYSSSVDGFGTIQFCSYTKKEATDLFESWQAENGYNIPEYTVQTVAKMEVANPQSSNCYSDSMNLMTGPFYAMIKTFMI